MIDLSCKDWRERIMAGRSLIPNIPLDTEQASRAIAIFNMLRVPDVPGQPPNKEAAGDWFREIVGAVFGTAPYSHPRLTPKPREVREFFVLVPKKNSKTTGGAGLMMTALLQNTRPRAEFLFIGPTQEISKIAYSQAVGMIEADPEGFLQKRMHVRDHLKEIVDRRTRAVLKIKTFDTSVVTGVKPAGVLIDELHEISRSSDAGRVIGQLRGGMIANPEAFLLFISTQSDEPPAGTFKDELYKARGIRDGLITGTMMPILYEFPETIAEMGRPGEIPRWMDTSLWWMVTPNRDRSVLIDRLIEDFHAANNTGPHELARWASQHLNIEIGLGLRTDRWMGTEYWDQATDPTLDLETLLGRSEVVVVGIDGGGLDDLFGLVVLGRDSATKDWLCWTHSWCHHGVLDRRRGIAARLRDFQARKELTIVDDRLEDLSEIANLVENIKNRGLLGAVAVDPAGLGEFVDKMAEIDVTVENKLLRGVGQGFRMMNAIKTTERRLASGTFRHCGSELMAWAVTNLKIEPTATAIRATRQVAGDAKIDPAMAMFDACDVMSTMPEAEGVFPPDYELPVWG